MRHLGKPKNPVFPQHNRSQQLRSHLISWISPLQLKSNQRIYYLLAIAIILHFIFALATFSAWDLLLTGKKALFWFGFLTFVTGLILVIDWILLRLLYSLKQTRKMAWLLLQGFGWVYLICHLFVALLLFMMWGFSFLSVVIIVPLLG